MASTNILPDDIDNTAGQTTETPNPKKPMKRVASFYTPYMEDRLRRKLKFYFMGPHEKFKAKRKCPWKLLLQIFKVFLVTAQVRITLMTEQSSCNLDKKALPSHCVYGRQVMLVQMRVLSMKM